MSDQNLPEQLHDLDKPLIKLLWMGGLALIVKGESGVYYVSQTGGTLCRQSVVEGWLLPLFDEIGFRDRNGQEDAFLGYFPQHIGDSSYELSEQGADFVDDQLQQQNFTKFLRVDRTMLKQSHEAWVHVVFEPVPEKFPKLGISFDPKESPYAPGTPQHDMTHYSMFGFKSKKGVLTWVNSD